MNKIMSCIFSIIIILGVIISSNINTFATDLNLLYLNNLKIQNELLEYIEDIDEKETFSVWVWFFDVEKKDINSLVESKTGLTSETISIIKNRGLSFTDYLSQTDCNENNYVNYNSSKLLSDYLYFTKNQRELETRLTDIYIREKREILSNLYKKYNKNIINDLGLSNEEVQFVSDLSPSAVVKVNKETITTLTQSESVRRIFLYDDSLEPYENEEIPYNDNGLLEKMTNEKHSCKADIVSDSYHLSGYNVNVLIVDNHYIRPDLYPFFSFPNLDNIYNIQNHTIYSVDNTQFLNDNNPDAHGTLVAYYLKNYAPDVNVYLAKSLKLSDIEWAVAELGINIINVSANYGDNSSYDSSVFAQWYDYLVSNYNVCTVASTGNAIIDGKASSPGCGYNTIGVGAYHSESNLENDYMNNFTFTFTDNYTTSVSYKPDVVVPGQSTSRATPALAGMISYLYQIMPSLKGNPEITKAIVLASCHRKVLSYKNDDSFQAFDEVIQDIINSVGEENIDSGLTTRQGAGAFDALHALYCVLSHSYGSVTLNQNTMSLNTVPIHTNYNDCLNVSISWTKPNNVTYSDYITGLNSSYLEQGDYCDVVLSVLDSTNSIVANSNVINAGKQMCYYSNALSSQYYKIKLTKDDSENQIPVKVGYAWSERGSSELHNVVLSGNTAVGQTLTATAYETGGVSVSDKEVLYIWEKSTDGNNWASIPTENTNEYTLSDNELLHYIRCTVRPVQSSMLANCSVSIETTNKIVKYGDVNLDGLITIDDVTNISSYLAYLSTFTVEQLVAGDVNGDGIISIIDATYIQLYIAGTIQTFPVEA